MEFLSPVGAIINNPDTYKTTSRKTIVFVECPKKMKGSVDDIYARICGGLFKEECGSIVSW